MEVVRYPKTTKIILSPMYLIFSPKIKREK